MFLLNSIVTHTGIENYTYTYQTRTCENADWCIQKQYKSVLEVRAAPFSITAGAGPLLAGPQGWVKGPQLSEKQSASCCFAVLHYKDPWVTDKFRRRVYTEVHCRKHIGPH